MIEGFNSDFFDTIVNDLDKLKKGIAKFEKKIKNSEIEFNNKMNNITVKPL